MKKIVGLGACVFDTLISCKEYPKEDTKLKAENVFVSGGGPVGNALVVMSKLGVNASAFGLLANDNAGNYMVKDFNLYGVNTNGIKLLNDKTSFTSYIILSESGNSRTCLFDRGNVPDEPKLLDYSILDEADILHLDGNYINCAIESAKYAKSKGIKVSLDAGGLYEGIEKLLPYIDILIPSSEFALGLTNEKEIPNAMKILKQKYNPKILVVTDGVNGGYYYENNNAIHYDSYKVKAIDTNGAGDTFHGAFLVALCDGKSIKECCQFASATSAYKVTNKGARTYLLNKEIINNFLKNN